MRRLRAGALLIPVAGSVILAAAIGPQARALAASSPNPTYRVATVGPKDGGGEPSITSSRTGELYVTYPAASGMPFYRSRDHGSTWQQGGTADISSGDDCIVTDTGGGLYECNLAGSYDSTPLHADVWKSTDDGGHWALARGTDGVALGADGNPFGVDRDWIDAWIPPSGRNDTSKAEVALMYHDFYGLSQIWVNMSTDGGADFGQPVDVLASPAQTPAAVAGTAQAQAASFCNTVPAGVKFVTSGAHAGRIYVAWIAADAATSVATGCNYTQLADFHSLWVAWSDDNGATWTPQLAFDGGEGHDASTPFVSFTLDDQGNPYFGFADNLGSEYDMYVIWSRDGGVTWDGGNAATGGAAQPIKVNADTGTHFYPAIAAGDPGKVDVAYLETTAVIPTLPTGKASPGGGKGDAWFLYAAQSLDLGSTTPSWAIRKVTPAPMHVGDICNLGIFCVDDTTGHALLGTNRDLLDFISVAVDQNGMAHIAFTNDNLDKNNAIQAANQTGGPSVFGGGGHAMPAAPRSSVAAVRGAAAPILSARAAGSTGTTGQRTAAAAPRPLRMATASYATAGSSNGTGGTLWPLLAIALGGMVIRLGRRSRRGGPISEA